MNNLSLTESELDSLIKAFAAIAIAIFCALLYFFWEPSETDNELLVAARFASGSLSITSLLLLAFVTKAWRLSWVASLMGRSVVHGVWAGRLTSDFGSQGGVNLPIVFVIRQTYLTISIESYTQQQHGESKLEALIHNKKTDGKKLSYVFELRRPYSPGGRLTTGAGELKLEGREAVLRGVYWTDSPTHGSLVLKRLAADVKGIASFDDAVRRYPQIGRT